MKLISTLWLCLGVIYFSGVSCVCSVTLYEKNVSLQRHRNDVTGSWRLYNYSFLHSRFSPFFPPPLASFEALWKFQDDIVRSTGKENVPISKINSAILMSGQPPVCPSILCNLLYIFTIPYHHHHLLLILISIQHSHNELLKIYFFENFFSFYFLLLSFF